MRMIDQTGETLMSAGRPEPQLDDRSLMEVLALLATCVLLVGTGSIVTFLVDWATFLGR